MAEPGPSTDKRFKCDEDDVFSIFHSKFLKEEPRFLELLDQLKEQPTGLGALEVGSCNAADPDVANCFTKAACTVRPTDSKYAFGNFFIDAFKLIKSFIKDNAAPEDENKKIVLCRLLNFLLDKDIQEPLYDLEMLCDDETELTVLLASHFFSRLSVSPTFTVDSNKSWKIKVCPCQKRHGKITYGDNSIGNPEVWHGNLDLIMDGAEVVVHTVDSKGESFQDTDSVTEVKQKHFQMTDVTVGSSIAQVAAETIVYSFYYRKLHSDNRNSLIPCIGICYSGIIIYFYDSIHDVLLGSTVFSLTTAKPNELNITTIIAVWMVLNHKYLCNGLSSVDVSEVPKSGFFKKIETKLDIYKHGMMRGNVRAKRESSKSVDPIGYTTSKFIVAEELKSL